MIIQLEPEKQNKNQISTARVKKLWNLSDFDLKFSQGLIF